ncbi:hypothetical protein KLP40_07875 [Hymenobacter sp. NST-14]|uniref:hypothetical protein n=1 Tax=Hymenobacter piscis TaxID=2839984 RepID=UPI001C01AB56|nr:hypothetical protein [Hymenobacter piscis]MBT9393078.1 hypothetical protein [Hymenobacter piscis]
MRVNTLAAPVVLALSLLAATPTLAQTPAATLPPAAPIRPLLKLGLVVGNEHAISSYHGISVPVFVGLEQQLTPGWTLTLNGTSSWHLGRRDFSNLGYRSPLVTQLSFDAGIRHYYHQARRQERGYRTGPYQGPYVGLQTRTIFSPIPSSNNQLRYDYSTISLLWGTQRRLGGHGLLDAYLSGGLANPRVYGVENTYQHRLGISLEAGVKLSLIRP